MPPPSLTPPATRPARRGSLPRTMLAAAALLLPPGPVQAAAPPSPPCPTRVDAAPPSEALALKNIGQELRAAGSLLRASRCFRDAVDLLPDCAIFADERLLWGLWAAETFEHAGVRRDAELHAFLEREVATLDARPESAALPDYPQLVAARDRQRQAAPATEPDGPPGAPLRATRVGLALMVSSAPLVASGGVLTGIFSARPARPSASAGVITGITLIGVGAALLVAGIVTYVQGRRAGRRLTRMQLRPAREGLALVGRF